MTQSVRPIKFDESTRVGVSPPENDRGRFWELNSKGAGDKQGGSRLLTGCCPIGALFE